MFIIFWHIFPITHTQQWTFVVIRELNKDVFTYLRKDHKTRPRSQLVLISIKYDLDEVRSRIALSTVNLEQSFYYSTIWSKIDFDLDTRQD